MTTRELRLTVVISGGDLFNYDFERLLGLSANGYVRAEAMLTVIVENFPRMFRINKVVKMEVVE